jgi:hypothetical protein
MAAPKSHRAWPGVPDRGGGGARGAISSARRLAGRAVAVPWRRSVTIGARPSSGVRQSTSGLQLSDVVRGRYLTQGRLYHVGENERGCISAATGVVQWRQGLMCGIEA